MPRQSTVTTTRDSAGDYEVEVFECQNPKRVIVCSHGGGVRRWDGEEFFYSVAEHFADSAVLLVDQNQLEHGIVKLNPLPVMVARVSGLIDLAKQEYPGVPIIVIAHSFGCGVASQLDISALSAMVLVAPTVGAPERRLIDQYGEEIVNGMQVMTSDNLQKIYTAEHYASLEGITWKDEYTKLVRHYSPVYAFEAGADEIISEEERAPNRSVQFTKYLVLDGAPHNLAGKPLADFFAKLDPLL